VSGRGRRRLPPGSWEQSKGRGGWGVREIEGGSGLVGQGREGQTFSFAPTFFIGRCVVLSAVLGMAFRFSPDFEACTSPAKAAA